MKWSPMWDGWIVEPEDEITKAALCCSAGDVVFFNTGTVIDPMTSHPIALRRKTKEVVENLNIGHTARWRAGMRGEKPKSVLSERSMSAAEYWAKKCHSGAEFGIDDEISLRPGKVWQVRKGELGQIDGRVNIRTSVPDTASGLRMLQEAQAKVMRNRVDAMAMALTPEVLIKQICDLKDALDAADPWTTDLASSNSTDVLEALHAVLGKPYHKREPVDVVLPIDDSVECFQRNGARVSDGVQPTPSKDANGFMKRYKRPRRAPDGIMTLAPQSGFCSSGNTIYAAMPE